MCGKCSILRQLPVFSQRDMAMGGQLSPLWWEKCYSILCLGHAKYIKVTSHKCVIASPPARSMDCNFQGPCFLRFLRSQRPCHVEQQVMINQWIDIYIYINNIVCSPHPSYGMGYDGVEPGQAYRHLRSKRHGCPELAG